MRAEIVSVGTELLLGQITDTNAAYLSSRLPELGIDLHFRSTVGDNETRLAGALELALSRADVVFTIGGLGPTQDDLTKETVAKVLGDELILDEQAASDLWAFFKARGVEMIATNLKQALIPKHGSKIPNPNGTAPGTVFEAEGGKLVLTLPGPPREFVPMVDDFVMPLLRERFGEAAAIIRSRVLRIAGVGESAVEDRIKGLLSSGNPTVAPLAGSWEVHLRITAKAGSGPEADAMLDDMDARLVSLLGDCVYGRDKQRLEDVVVGLLREKGLKLSVAESCTGGLLANRITNVPGSSDVFDMGVVSYSNQSKMKLLGVPEEMLIEHGAVSEEVAAAMAEGVRRVSGSDVTVGITGIAGPTGGTPTKPVGLVYMSLGIDGHTQTTRNQFPGGREDVKQRSTQTALNMVRLALLSRS
jgi:nicotinamide-nucleotide amidase